MRRFGDLSVCILAGNPFQKGGVERLTLGVRAALTDALGDERVATFAVAGQAEGRDGWSAGERVTIRTKSAFAGTVIGRIARRHPRAVLIVMHVNLSQVARVASGMWGNPYVVWAHGAEVWADLQPLPGWGLRGADHVLCSSEFTRTQIVDRHNVVPERSLTLHPAVSASCLDRAARVRRTAGSSAPVILSVGRLSREAAYKRFDAVIEALPIVMGAVPNVRYVIVGEGTGREDLRSLARTVGVEDRVEFRSADEDDRLWDAYESARVFAMPSAFQLGRRPVGEGFGITLAEAAIFGRPVVGPSGGGSGEAFRPGVTGEAVDAGDRRQLADALVRYLSDPDEADRAGVAGRAWALERFTPARFAQDLLGALGLSGSNQRVGAAIAESPS